uniref:Putative secreted protein n=1 Tax=Anopheles darlingi TaxID=43151 RepID=A0A2M4DH13_ANODA
MIVSTSSLISSSLIAVAPVLADSIIRSRKASRRFSPISFSSFSSRSSRSIEPCEMKTGALSGETGAFGTFAFAFACSPGFSSWPMISESEGDGKPRPSARLRSNRAFFCFTTLRVRLWMMCSNRSCSFLTPVKLNSGSSRRWIFSWRLCRMSHIFMTAIAYSKPSLLSLVLVEPMAVSSRMSTVTSLM